MNTTLTVPKRKTGNYVTKKELAAMFGISVYRLRQELSTQEMFTELLYLKRPLKPQEWKPVIEFMLDLGFEEIG